MFDLAWGEIFVIGLVAVLVLGPKELPQAMRTLAKAIRKVRSLGSEFQGHFNDMLREAELEELRKQVKQFSQTSLTEHVANYVDPKGDVAKEVETALQDPDAKVPAPEPGMDGSPLPAIEAPTETAAAPDAVTAEPATETAAPAPEQNKPAAT